MAEPTMYGPVQLSAEDMRRRTEAIEALVAVSQAAVTQVQQGKTELIAKLKAQQTRQPFVLGSDRHGVDYEFQADDFDDLKYRPAATRPEIEQAPVVLILERHYLLDRVFDVRVGDAVFTC